MHAVHSVLARAPSLRESHTAIKEKGPAIKVKSNMPQWSYQKPVRGRKARPQ